jgi:16S rRNA (uracil1498-N3)-methyltransferase
MAERYYVRCPLGPGPVTLDGDEAHHLRAVCRARPGDLVTLFNGDGREYAAAVTAVERRHVDLEVTASSAPARELPHALTLAAPLPKGDRAALLVEKLTELGVTTFQPLRTRRSVVHPGEGKAEKLQRQVIEASKQCGRNVLMGVADLAPWEAWATRADLPRQRLLAHPTGEPWRPDLLRPEDSVAAVGPEGGFTDEEVALARNAGWRVVALGPRILRVETAALAVAALAATVLGGAPGT